MLVHVPEHDNRLRGPEVQRAALISQRSMLTSRKDSQRPHGLALMGMD